ncbi:hypothetical protein [Moraxella atlantae]|uniref:hypothetical protein n=1 Tax=Faucicola atlantae TaxID=34059 RepID=UPI0012E8A6B6|nr:hypothetical protein [Moraxella atlantae]
MAKNLQPYPPSPAKNPAKIKKINHRLEQKSLAIANIYGKTCVCPHNNTNRRHIRLA